MNFEDIKGLGKSRIEKLRAAGIYRPLDLLLHFPYRYADLRAVVDVKALQDGDALTVYGMVTQEPKTQFLRKGLRICRAMIDTQYGLMEAVWFNQKYIASALPCGKTVYLAGKVKKFRNKISLSAPTILQPNGQTVLPIYRPIAGVPQRVITDAVGMLLERANISGYIPDALRQANGLPTLNDAFRQVHRPQSIAAAQEALRALSLEKLSYTLSMFQLVKNEQRNGKKFVYTKGKEVLMPALQSLPFALTDGQQQAIDAIVDALGQEKAMNRLLQGDVGCGKTVVALLAMYYAYCNGYQSVLMAPTEILAEQHYRSAIRYLEKLGVRAVLLCGSLSKAERDNVLFAIRSHMADVIIGTHALLGDDVVFADLSLIITDEQQRFGVNQRGLLESKAPNADTLVMTATPIPRTLALCMYGELEQSHIRTLPSGRPPVDTATVPEAKFESMLAYAVERAAAGEQTYIVCPRIESDEEENLVSAVQMYRHITEQFPSCKAGLLHGKLKEAEKSDVMQRFAQGKIGILVSTTVVEVGMDVPNATNMIIYNAERYGLSQLHQLRGRVGRGTKHSYCFLPFAGEVPERLRYFCGCNDGFALSEYDFAQRGAGDFIGTRQHGEADDLPVKMDSDLIFTAKSIAEQMLDDVNTVMRLRAALTDGTEQYVRSITMN